MVDTDRVTGAVGELSGTAQAVAGDLIGSNRASFEDRIREAHGTTERLYGQAKDAARHATHELSDRAEDA